ncbi:MAG: elongation factor 1-beta [Candidatus Nanoarchaeia archaeon]
MGTALVKIKIMPESPSVDLSKIEADARAIVEKITKMPLRVEKEPIAFGLVALIVTFAIDESLDMNPVEESLRAIENVSSSEVIDFRRAFG